MLFASADGATFEPVAGLAPGELVTAVGAGPAGFAVTGRTVAGDGFLLAGSDVRLPARLDVPGLGGIGEQVPSGVVVRDDSVVVLGMTDGAPTSWPVSVG